MIQTHIMLTEQGKMSTMFYVSWFKQNCVNFVIEYCKLATLKHC